MNIIMKNNKLGAVLVILSIVLLVVFLYFRAQVEKDIDQQIELSLTDAGECLHENVTGGICPFERRASLALPTFIGAGAIIIIFLLGIYLIFRKEKKQEIIKEIKEVKEDKKEDKFNIILSALNEDEQKVMKAVKEQDGITQATLRIRIDMSKTKLSVVLKELEKKNLVKKIIKGKTYQIFLKRAF